MNDDGDEEIVENGRLCLSLSLSLTLLSYPIFLVLCRNDVAFVTMKLYLRLFIRNANTQIKKRESLACWKNYI